MGNVSRVSVRCGPAHSLSISLARKPHQHRIRVLGRCRQTGAEIDGLALGEAAFRHRRGPGVDFVTVGALDCDPYFRHGDGARADVDDLALDGKFRLSRGNTTGQDRFMSE